MPCAQQLALSWPLPLIDNASTCSRLRGWSASLDNRRISSAVWRHFSKSGRTIFCLLLWEVAFDGLEQQLLSLRRPDGWPVQVLILGARLAGKYAVKAAIEPGSLDRFQHCLREGVGAAALTAGRSVTSRPDWVETLFRQTDILVEATARRDPLPPVVRGEGLVWLRSTPG